MKTPRVKDFDPDAKVPTLKSSLDNMPSIQQPQLPNSKLVSSSAILPEKPMELEKQSKSILSGQKEFPTTKQVPVREPVPLGVPLIPKAKRLIKQRQPFDIYEDQYVELKKIAETERDYINGKGMSQMVREAIDNYLKERSSSNGQ